MKILSYLRRHPIIIGLIVLSVMVRLGTLAALTYAHGYDAILLGDSTHYLIVAENVFNGIGYMYDGYPEAYRAPGYPAFLYLFVATGIPLIAGSLIQIAIASLIAPATYLLMRRFGVGQLLAAIAAAALAIEPVMVFYSVVLMPDVFFSILTLCAGWCALRFLETGAVRYLPYAGIACGIANYMRPADLYLPIAFVLAGALALAYRREFSIRTASALLLIPFFSFIVMSPWYVRNIATFGVPEFVSSQAPNLYKYGAGSTLAIAQGRDFAPVVKELYEKAAREMPHPDINAFENQEYLVRESKQIIAEHPAAFLKAYVLGLNGFWFSGNYHSLFARYGLISAEHRTISYSMVLGQQGVWGLMKTIAQTFDVYVFVGIFGKVLWMGICLSAVLGMWIMRRRPEAWIAALLCAYFSVTLLSTTIGIEARHRYALNPLLIAFSAVAISWMYAFVRTRLFRV